jgi:hypothetical protein
VRQGGRGQAKLTTVNKGFMKFIEKFELNGDDSNWWVPDTECVKGMLRTAGFQYFSQPVYMNGSRLLLLASKRRDSLLDLSAIA